MRKYVTPVILVIFIASFSTIVRADSPESIMNDSPSLPGDACTLQKKDKEDFLAKVSKLKARVEAELRRHKKDAKNAVKNNEDKVRASMTGGTPAMDKAAMKKMSKEERKAMAIKYASEMMSNPDQIKVQQNRIVAVGAAQSEQTAELQKLTARFEKFKQQLAAVENDPRAKALMTNDIMPLRAIAFSKVGVASNDGLEQDLAKLNALENRYCNMLSPRWLAIMNDYQNALKASLDEFNRFDKKQAETSRTMGSGEAFVEPGISALQEMDDFLGKMANTFQYTIKTKL